LKSLLLYALYPVTAGAVPVRGSALTSPALQLQTALCRPRVGAQRPRGPRELFCA
uniref:Uncharacterized protein n=1 Tax=Suricata suricatta TaxID=37032 RepID=A0A673SPJ6_SURSU